MCKHTRAMTAGVVFPVVVGEEEWLKAGRTAEGSSTDTKVGHVANGPATPPHSFPHLTPPESHPDSSAVPATGTGPHRAEDSTTQAGPAPGQTSLSWLSHLNATLFCMTLYLHKICGPIA